MLDDIDCRIISRICGDLGDALYPYRVIAEELGCSEEEVLARLRSLQQHGQLRRFGAILRHQLAGFTANGMSVWDVPEEDVERVGAMLATFPEITHCYERPRMPDWPYNVYAMIHARSREECEAIVQRISAHIGISTYQMLYSEREFKKTSMQYFAREAV